MSIRRIYIYLLFAVLFTVMQTQIFSNGQDLVAGRNVNMVRDDPYLQRQNEPSIAVSTVNPRHLLAGANDYSLVDFYGLEVEVTYDAWLGVFKSLDGGESWDHDLLPPYQGVLTGGTKDKFHPLSRFDAAADPTVRAGLDGWFYYSGIAFERKRNGDSVIFIIRYKDNGSSIDYVDTTIIDDGTSGQFQDKPWIGTDKHNRVWIIYSIFLGELDKNQHTKIMIAQSDNDGETWGSPSKLSESHQKNQGTTVAVDPNDGTLYVAWRRYLSSNAPHAILIAKSDDHGKTFTKAEEVATIDYTFDQETMGSQFGASQFRTLAFPTIAVDDYDDPGYIYLAWTQRISADGDTRIVITSLAKDAWGSSWLEPKTVEPLIINDPRPDGKVDMPCHQVMPTLTYGAGKLMLAWFDTRFSARRYDEYGNLRSNAPGRFPWIRDDGNKWDFRETMDVRLAQADPGPSLLFGQSIQVSRYLWVLEVAPDNEGPNGEELYRLRQGQFDPPGYKMFSGGTVPFHGDYIDIAHSPDEPFTFYVTWTDNRDVKPPGNDGFWGDYTPPEPFDPDIHGECTTLPNEVVVGMRNQNIYCSRITRGIQIGTLNNNQAPGNNSFVIFVSNLLNPPDPKVPNDSLTFTISLSSETEASFSFSPLTETEEPLTEISVSVPYYTTIVRQVFVSGSEGDSVKVRVERKWNDVIVFEDEIYLYLVAEGIPSGSASIFLNGTTLIDWASTELIATLNPNILKLFDNTNITGPSIDPNIMNPNITSPNITSPNITSPSIDPNIMNPNITSPNITSPNITSPNITSPNITSPNITSPNITSPNITSIPPSGTKIADKVWSVHNDGTAFSAYTFKGIAGESLPPDEFIFTQLLIYKVHYTHSTNGCYLMTEAHHELLVNIVSPFITTYTDELNIKEFLSEPEAWNADIYNATFSLAPGEHAVLILRVIDTKPNREIASATTSGTKESSSVDPAKITYDEAGSVYVSHSSTTSAPVGSASLMILPDVLPQGIQAGQEFPETTFTAIGGTLNPESDYTWSHTWIEPDPTFITQYPDWGLTIVDNVLSGTSRWIGPISFTMEVKDDDPEHSDTHTFSTTILDPDPLNLDMDVPTPANPYKEGDVYTINNPLATFTASGGVPQYFWTDTYNAIKPTTWSSGLSLKPTANPANPGEMGLVGTLVAGEWDIAVKLTDDRLPPAPTDPEAFKVAEFTLCVSPLPLTINLPAATELEWSLGTSKSVQITVSNAVLPPTWTASDLPAGIDLDTGVYPINLTGAPVFDPDLDYPATYSVTVSVTDPFKWCGFGPTTVSETFDIIVNPKEPEWDKQETNDGVAIAVTADPAGNTYVTGYTGTEPSRDYFTVMYNTEGARQWGVTYNGPAGGDDVPRAIAADVTGVYVTGFSEGTTSGRDIYTVKYNPDGGQEWEVRYDGPSHMGDEPNGMALDGAHVYVAGFVHRGNKTAHKDYTIVKYDKDTGSEVWDVRYDSRRNGMDEATAIAVDSGNVYVTGMSQESSQKNAESKSFDYLTLKYNSSGQLQWGEKTRDDGLVLGDDEPTAIAVDADGYVYVTGQQNIADGDTDFYTVKYDTYGNLIWASESYGESGLDRALAVAFDEAGNVYVTGKLMGTDGYDYATIKYFSADGAEDWAEVYASGNGDDIPVGLAFGEENGTGFVFVAGFKSTDSNGKDFFTIKYLASNRTIAWIAQYNSGLGVHDEATAMFMNNTGLYVTGFTPNGFLTVKYTK